MRYNPYHAIHRNPYHYGTREAPTPEMVAAMQAEQARFDREVAAATKSIESEAEKDKRVYALVGFVAGAYAMYIKMKK
jgi:hypothetical protein